MFKVALAGYPNVGKTSLFNLLTGKNNKTGNWEGVTVELDQAPALFSKKIQIFDLPGLKTLSKSDLLSADQEVAQAFLQQEKPDLVINLIHPKQLEEQLLFSFELYELGLQLLLVVVLEDADQVNFTFLNCDLFPFYKNKRGIVRDLIRELEYLCYNKANNLEYSEYLSKINCNNHAKIEAIDLAKKLYIKEIAHSIKLQNNKDYSHILDKIFLNKLASIPIFLAIVCSILGFTIWGGEILKEPCEFMVEQLLIEPPVKLLHVLNVPPFLVDLYQNGLGIGLKTLFGFLPLLSILYFLLGIVEDSGYMARISLIMSEKFSKVGLSGRAIIPLIVGFGCNVPAILGTRIIGDPKERLLTILLIPFMSCGARLTLFALFASIFFPNSPVLAISSLYFLSIFLAFLVALTLKSHFKKEKSLSPMVLPQYKKPNLTNIFKQVLHKIEHFIIDTGKLILFISFLLYNITALQWDDLQKGEITFNPQLTNNSFMVVLGEKITPLFKPLGIEENNWPAAVSLLTGVVAKEVVASTLLTLYEINNPNSLNQNELIRGFFNENQAFAYLIFVLIYFPCITVFAVMKKEAGLKFAIYSSIFYTLLAYCLATIFYQISLITGFNLGLNLLLLIILLSLCIYPLQKLLKFFLKH